ncbi:hypothetical protein SLS56_004177 [Neofusicoccum ribis]|uniref:N-acetyltransferase domain-containing protein n=1 Tax=Neofusicoccum ribis TaxID=45134 RepID=A0ABR3SY99_9PEZI
MDQAQKPQFLPMEEADLEEAARMEVYGNPEDDMQRILFERIRTPAGVAGILERRRKTFRNEPSATFLKVIDPVTQDIMAWAIWYLCPERTEEEVAKGFDIPEWPLPAFYRQLGGVRHEIMQGRPHYVLGMIVTDPNYRRRGAANMLLQWGAARADEAGVDIYIESSIAGRPLYESFGCRTLRVVEFDMAQLGYQGVDVHTIMLRPAQAKAS